jgi:hypothetical protein
MSLFGVFQRNRQNLQVIFTVKSCILIEMICDIITAVAV